MEKRGLAKTITQKRRKLSLVANEMNKLAKTINDATKRGSWAKSHSWAELANEQKVGWQKQKLNGSTNKWFCAQHKKWSFNWEQTTSWCLAALFEVQAGCVKPTNWFKIPALHIIIANFSWRRAKYQFLLAQLWLELYFLLYFKTKCICMYNILFRTFGSWLQSRKR